MIPSTSSPAATRPTDTHQNGTPVRKLCVPSITIEKASGEYLRKYQTSPYAQSIVRAEVLSTTLRLEPR